MQSKIRIRFFVLITTMFYITGCSNSAQINDKSNLNTNCDQLKIKVEQLQSKGEILSSNVQTAKLELDRKKLEKEIDEIFFERFKIVFDHKECFTTAQVIEAEVKINELKDKLGK